MFSVRSNRQCWNRFDVLIFICGTIFFKSCQVKNASTDTGNPWIFCFGGLSSLARLARTAYIKKLSLVNYKLAIPGTVYCLLPGTHFCLPDPVYIFVK